MKGGTVEASKYTSLKKLYAIRDNSYRGYHNKSGEVKDYDKHSVDQMIWEKESKLDDKNTKKELNDQDLYANHLRSTPIAEMSLQEYEDYYLIETGKLPWATDADEGFKKAVLALAIQRESGDSKPTKKRVVKKPTTKKPITTTKKPKTTKKKEPTRDEELAAIDAMIEELHNLHPRHESEAYNRLRFKIKGLLQKQINNLWHRLEIWGEFENTNEDIELMRQRMERFTGQKISRFKSPEDANYIDLHLSKSHAESSDISCPIDWARSMTYGNSHHCRQWEPTEDYTESFELQGKSRMIAYYTFTERSGDKILSLTTDITRSEFSQLFV